MSPYQNILKVATHNPHAQANFQYEMTIALLKSETGTLSSIQIARHLAEANNSINYMAYTPEKKCPVYEVLKKKIVTQQGDSFSLTGFAELTKEEKAELIELCRQASAKWKEHSH